MRQTISMDNPSGAAPPRTQTPTWGDPDLTGSFASNFGLTGKVRRCPEADSIKLRVVIATLPDPYPNPWKGRDATMSGNGSAHTKTQ